MLGLVALMEIQASRIARVGPSGRPVLLLDQDRSRWDYVLVGRGWPRSRVPRSSAAGFGLYALQASIAACHARARVPEDTNWPRILALYDALAELALSPVVDLNRAVALGMAFGPELALEVVDGLTRETASRVTTCSRACAAICSSSSGGSRRRSPSSSAPSLTDNAPERRLLLERAAACAANGRSLR